MSEAKGPSDKEVLANTVDYLANVITLTSKWIDEVLAIMKAKGYWLEKYKEASARQNFWANAIKGLDTLEVGTLFSLLFRLPDVSNNLAKLATLGHGEQSRLADELRELAKLFKDLTQKLSTE